MRIFLTLGFLYLGYLGGTPALADGAGNGAGNVYFTFSSCTCACIAVGGEMDGREIVSVPRRGPVTMNERQCRDWEASLNARGNDSARLSLLKGVQQTEPAFSCSGFTASDQVRKGGGVRRQGEWRCTRPEPGPFTIGGAG